MNISQNMMMELKSIQQPDMKPGLNPEGMGRVDNFKFDSMLDNFRTEAVTREPKEINKTAEKTGMHSSVNNENESRAYNKVDRKQEQADRRAEVNEADRKHEADEASRRAEKQDNDENVIRAEAAKDTPGDKAADVKDNRMKVSAEEENTGQTDVINGTEDGAEADASFADELNNNGDKALKTGPETEPVQAENNAGEINASNTDAIISDLLNSHNDEALKNVSGEFKGKAAVEAKSENSGPDAENGLKTDKLFSGLLKDSSVENAEAPEAVQQDGIEGDESLKNETGLKDAGAPDNRDRGRMVSDMLAEANKSSGNEDSDAADQARIDSLLKNMNRDASGARAEHSGSFSPSDENTDSGQDLAGEFRFQDETSEGGLQSENNNAKILTGRIAAGFAENIVSESVSKGQAVKPAVQVHSGSGNSNAGMVNNSATMHNSGRTGEGLHNVNSAKAPAFTDIVDKVVYVAKGGNRLGVTLDHADLGKLHINLRLEKGLINVQINAPDRITSEYVENNVQQIVSSLEEQGITVGGFSVALQNNRSHEGYSHWNRKAYNSFNEKKTEYAVEPQIVRSAGGASSMLSIFA